jgi:hypothetical protein
MEMDLATYKMKLSSKRREAQMAEERAKRNQERWIKFRHDMTNLYALHEYCCLDSDDAMQRIADWGSLSDCDQQDWLQIGRNFVERSYGSWIG